MPKTSTEAPLQLFTLLRKINTFHGLSSSQFRSLRHTGGVVQDQLLDANKSTLHPLPALSKTAYGKRPCPKCPKLRKINLEKTKNNHKNCTCQSSIHWKRLGLGQTTSALQTQFMVGCFWVTEGKPTSFPVLFLGLITFMHPQVVSSALLCGSNMRE